MVDGVVEVLLDKQSFVIPTENEVAVELIVGGIPSDGSGGGGGGEGGTATALVLNTVDTGEPVRVVTFSNPRSASNVPVSTPDPLPPVGFTVDPKLYGVTLTWPAAPTPVGQYAIWKGGVQIATTTQRNYRDLAIAAGQTYTYQIQTIDPYGQRSPKTVSQNAFIDPATNHVPTMVLSSWPEGETFPDAKSVIRLAALDPDGQSLNLALSANTRSVTPTDDPSVYYSEPGTGDVTYTGTATDPLGASHTATLDLAEGIETGVSTIRTSFFANRVNWGNSITDNVQGPETGTPDPYQHIPGPWTFGMKFTPLVDTHSPGMRVMKMPAGHGAVQALMWAADGTQLASKAATWVADDGGWYEFTWDSPVFMAKDTPYFFGYYYPTADTNWAFTSYVWNNGQDTCVYPLNVLGSEPPTFKKAGGPTFSNTAGDYAWHNYYIDPIVDRDVDIPQYESGTEYYNQFPNADMPKFPLVIDFADPQWLTSYAALNFNMVSVTDAADQNAIDQVKASGLKWMPMLYGDNMAGPFAVISDPAVADNICGYFITDEPEYAANGVSSPANVRSWRNHARRIDSTRPQHINLGRQIIENQGFLWLPVGISAKDVNLQWREYCSLADIVSMDGYGIANTFPYTYSANDSKRYGIWIYPLQIHRMRTEMTDGSKPIWGEVETTSSYDGSPTPDQVKKAVWSMLIAGAKGMLYFDHRFSSPQVSQDFAAMIHDSAMSAAVSALNLQITSLADALVAPEAKLIASAKATNAMAKTQGGIPQGCKIPMHYSSRHFGSTYYFFVQSIRDGSAGNVTVSIPGFQGATLTVIGESRTVTVDGTGKFTDTFTGDYAYHLYSTTAVPSFTAPANTAAPTISGTPQTGQVLTVSNGTWTGVPAPTFTYQWYTSTDGGSTYSQIPGAVNPTYTLLVGNEGHKVRCRVIATNTAGSSFADSAAVDAVAPTGPPPSGYATTILAKTPTFFARGKDFTDSSGNGHDLTLNTAAGTIAPNAASLITDASDGSFNFDFSALANASTPDSADLRLTGQAGFSAETWTNWPGGDGAFLLLSKVGDFRLNTNGAKKFMFTVLGSGGWFGDAVGTTAMYPGLHHVVGTWELATKLIKIYVNGTLEATADASTWGYTPTTSGWGPLVIGKNSGMSGDGMAAGSLDELAIYQYALSAAQVAENYAAGIA